VENFDDVTVVGEPACNVRRIRLAGGNHFGDDELTVSGDGKSDPFGLGGVAALRD
jgi:hypothetical protein